MVVMRDDKSQSLAYIFSGPYTGYLHPDYGHTYSHTLVVNFWSGFDYSTL
jgi:hypothetical protein